MFKESRLVYIYTESPLHPGSGTSLGYVDLPIQRESHTGLPMIQASGIKGALRDSARIKGIPGECINIIFGPEKADYASAISLADGKLLLFPVPALQGIFAWTTSPFLLKRFKRDIEWTGKKKSNFNIPEVNDGGILCANNCDVKLQDSIVLGEYTFNASECSDVNNIANLLKAGISQEFTQDLPKKLIIIPDKIMKEFTEYFIQVITRIKMDPYTGTVDKKTGGLWTEEHIPPESLFYTILMSNKPKFQAEKTKKKEDDKACNGITDEKEVIEYLKQNLFVLDHFRMGGNKTVGRGIVKITMVEEAKNDHTQTE